MTISLGRAMAWLGAAAVVVATGRIVRLYVDYVPPNFAADFLVNREPLFASMVSPYRWAFYAHIVVSPPILLAALVLLSDRFRQRFRRVHRLLGRGQVLAILGVLVPSSLVMALHAYGGWPAGLSFVVLTVLTALCTAMGWRTAVRTQFDRHRQWMLRTFALLVSAVVLRVLSGSLSLIVTDHPEAWYIAAAWASWLVPLGIVEWFAAK
jgi:uncharacterized membrane protein